MVELGFSTSFPVVEVSMSLCHTHVGPTRAAGEGDRGLAFGIDTPETNIKPTVNFRYATSQQLFRRHPFPITA